MVAGTAVSEVAVRVSGRGLCSSANKWMEFQQGKKPACGPVPIRVRGLAPTSLAHTQGPAEVEGSFPRILPTLQAESKSVLELL